MRTAQAEAAYLQLVFHDDDETPYRFMVDLARSVFGLPAAVAAALGATVESQGKAVCGTYPGAVAEALLQAAQQRIAAAGQSMVRVSRDREQGFQRIVSNDFRGS